MGWNFVRRRMASELGPDWQGKFTTFTQEAVAAASLGQVHRATLSDGRVLACKLQYPDMPNIVEGDLKQLKLAMGIYARMDTAIHSDEIYKELAERLREEVDYRREAAQMRLYGLMLAADSFVSIPKPVETLSTSRLLSMDWLEGTGMQAYLDTKPSQESRNRTAKVEHEATTSKISEDQLFYCRSRGLSQEDAVGLIVNGFCKDVLKELPMEFAVEAQKLLAVSLEGSVG